VPLTGGALERANEIYAGLRFGASGAARDRTFGVLRDGRLLALGRIQCHADDSLEVGGFWVHENERGRGLARRLVRHVLDALPAGREVWCLPFEHLLPFYESFGMQRVDCAAELPEGIRAKRSFCGAHEAEGHYAKTALLRFET